MAYVYGVQMDIRIMRMDIAAEIMNTFYSDIYIGSCVERLDSFIFKGGVEVKAGKLGRKIPLDEHGLIHILKTALGFKRMFGLCPFKIYMEDDEPRIAIPQVTQGRFVMVMNREIQRPDVLFILNEFRGQPVAITEMMAKQDLYAKAAEMGYHVYVWPGNTPDYRTNRFMSSIARIYNKTFMMRELWQNLMTADHGNSHPTLVTTQNVKAKDSTDLTGADIFGTVSDAVNELSPEDKYLQRQIQLKMRNIENMFQEANSFRNMRLPIKTIDDDTGGYIMMRRAPHWLGNMLPLFPGETPTNIQMPTSRSDILNIHDKFSEEVCLSLGISRRMLNDDSAGRYTSATSGEISRENLGATILSARQDAISFFQQVYACMMWSIENRDQIEEAPIVTLSQTVREAVIEEALSTVQAPKEPEKPSKKKKKNAPEGGDMGPGPVNPVSSLPAIQAGFGATEVGDLSQPKGQEDLQELKQRVLCEDRDTTDVVLEFREHPFLEMTDEKSLISMFESGIIDQEEFANIWRRKSGLRPLSKGEITKNMERKHKEKNDELVFAQKLKETGFATKKAKTEKSK